MKTKKMDTRRLVLLAMLSGIMLIMSFTPLGYLNIGPLAISLNMIPVAIGAVALGPGGGAFLGAVFDSFLGSNMQVKYKCKKCNAIVESKEHCSEKTVKYSGFTMVTNDAVNFFGTLFAAVAACGIKFII